MLADITIGQYFPGNSLIHRLDPRTKILSLLSLITIIFIVNSPVSYGLICLFTIIVIGLSNVPFLMVLKSIKPLWWIILFTVLIHIFTTPGEAIAKVWLFSITMEGIQQASFMSLRLILLIVLSSLLTLTTSPITLTDALEKLLTPFKKIGLPAHELAMMMTIALRFIPTLLEETERIMKAQEARGADFSSGGIIKRIKNMIPLLVPLFISAFRRADDLAVAMEARCYRGGENRTRMKVLRIGTIDYQACGIMLIFLLGLCVLKVYGL